MRVTAVRGFARLVGRDLRYGLRQVAGRVIVLLLGVNVLCYLLFTLVASGNTVVGGLSFADYMASCVGGISVYIPRDGEAFKLPAGWLCLCAGIAYIVLDYPARDFAGTGAQAMVAAGGRVLWWLAKCAWVVLACVAIWLLIVVACVFWALVFGNGLDSTSLKFTPGVSVLLGFDAPVAMTNDMSAGFIQFLVTFPLVIGAVCLFQAVLSVRFAPLVGFAATVALLLVSALAASPALPGNFLMLARCDFVSVAGLPPVLGCVAAAPLSIVAVLTGVLCCLKRDIYGREADAS